MRLKARRRVVVPAKPEEAPAAPPTLPLEEVWREADAAYANRKAMKPRRGWWAGTPERVPPGRVRALLHAPAAKTVAPLIARLSDGDFRVFQARAAVNLEQAVAALRLCVLVNVSAPVGAILLANALFPGSLIEAFDDRGVLIGALCGLVVGVVYLLLLFWYAYAGTHGARDLHHLTLVEAARRGVPVQQAGDQNATETRL